MRSSRTAITRLTALLLCLLLALPLAAAAQESGLQTVRVGWYESPFNSTDRYGRRSGYAYEYQRKVAAYAGWRYQYVEGSWSELLEMLKKGDIDLLSDVSYTRERTADMLFASLPMGTEAYHVFIAPDNAQITSEDTASLNGKTVGVNRGSVQRDLFIEWTEMHGVQVNLTELTVSLDESLQMLKSGALDALVTLDSYGDPDAAVPVWKIGSTDFYFAVNKARPDLLTALDAAMNAIQDENLYYNQQLHEKYLGGAKSNLYLTAKEKEWLLDHGTIRVGYQDNYLAFCASDEVTGALTGALKDYLEYASTVLENAHLDFQAISFPTADAAMEALKNGEVDCMFPANLTENDSEALGVIMSPALMRTEMDAVVRASEQKEFIRKANVVVAVNQGNTNYDMFLEDQYPGWQRAYFKDTPTGLEAVAAGGADCVIISNYRFNNISKQCEKLHLTTVYTGVDMDYYFALRAGDTQLYSILAKITGAVPASTINTALTYYSTEDVKTSFADLIKDNLFIVMAVIALVLVIILVLLLRSIRAEKKVLEEERMVNDLNRRVNVDALTSVHNKGAFDEYIKTMQARMDQGEPMQYAIGVFDCDDLKSINDLNGHDKGDAYLKTASRVICRVFQHSPVFRIGGDEFAAVLQNEDYENREELVNKFEAMQSEICASAQNKWDEVRVALGIAVYDPENDRSVNDTVRRADKLMYENKRMGKRAHRG